MKNVGFIGVGDMGMGMAKNLLKAGFTVRAYDMNSTRLQNFANEGGIACKSSAEVGLDSDVVFIMVVNAAQAEAVSFGKNGLVEGMKPGSTVILTATIGIKGAEKIADKLMEHKINLIDSGVSGGQNGANAGTMTMMASGNKQVFDNCLDVMNAVGKDIYFVGEKPGLGQVVKSCMQALVGCTQAATFELLVLGTKAGLDPKVLYDVISTSVVGSNLFKNTVPLILDRKFTGTGALSTITLKDLGITLDLAKELGVPMVATSVANQIFQAGATKSPGEDNQSVIKVLEDIVGVEVKSKK